MEALWPKYESKMRAEGLNDAAIAAFKYNLNVLVSGANTMIPETAILPVESLPALDDISVEPRAGLLQQTLMLKLNGGLGTGMGLDKAKSLLTVCGGNSFLDLIAKQVGSMKESFGVQVAFMLMNSFSTSADTLEALSKYPELGTGSDLEFVQNKAPKVDASSLEPASWPTEPGHEWCPPGHGDLYPAMLGSGTLDRLLAKGYKYMFVSNSDNLGALMDLKLLTYFADSQAPFMMEVAERTEADKKGGHLAKDKSTNGLLLRESAQCPDEDEAEFQNVGKYKYFNTNNLWVDLVALKAMFEKFEGSLPLPVMKNGKTVDPRDKKSTKVIQLETAMGAAISCFEGATAIKIPRTRFAPVKTTNDLLALRSDAYKLNADYSISLNPQCNGIPPNIKLDGMYKFVDAMDTLTPSADAVPSLVFCKKLVIEGPMEFSAGVVLKGSVTFKNTTGSKLAIPAGTYEDAVIDVADIDPMAKLWPKYESKMKAEGLNDAAIAAFKYNLGVLVSGANTMIPESAISSVESLPSLEAINVTPKAELLPKTLMLKLNGGLGTGMGLDKAKSLLPVTGDNTFLDLIAQQVGCMKQSFGVQVAFMLMNSFSTSADTLEALSKYPSLGTGSDLEFVQNKAPKVTASNLEPASWPKEPGHEWCPPGHGDLYPAMLGSGALDKLLAKGYKYMFVSNSDNLGATMDLKILTYFAESKAPFMMEVAERTDADKKGGHLAKDNKTGGLLLRESAQCPDEDEAEFQNVSKYKYFNTNNLWVDLVALKAMFDKFNGSLPLPVMKNGKTVDPRDKNSTKVIQLETAMGAAISCFQGATAIKIPRTRFAPVKTTNDLIALRSDAYVLTPDFRIELAPARNGVPPNIKLDGMYKFVDAMDTLIPNGTPSLVGCKKLVVEGPIEFAAGVVVKGSVTFKNSSKEKLKVPAGTYEDTTVDVEALPASEGDAKMAALWPKYEAKMKAEGLSDAAIAAFKYNLSVLVSGADTMIPESSLEAAGSQILNLEDMTVEPNPDLLPKTLMLKLNGGLGTGMGLDKAKSLLPVTDGNSFLDLIAKQVGFMKKSFGVQVAFMLMNSFSTSADTLEALSKYPELGTGSNLEFVQNKAPKVTESNFEPASWPADPSHEWCPPGHGDLYPAMLGSGTLDKRLAKGYKYMFVSNSDNLGATMDLKILAIFAQSKAPFMMEVAERTEADKKGGHLAKDKKTGGLLLRESAQCPDEDEAEFQNVNKHKYFNTNNLWVDLEALKAMFDKFNGSLPLPVMKNGKTVDPRDKKSTKVIQLETAMGAAISCFQGATAIKIPRTRFAPVKTTNDLLALRSDAYVLTPDFRIELAPSRNGVPPNIKLDGMYKFVDAMDSLIPNGVPSLIACKKLVVEGPLEFAAGVVVKGSVTFKNPGTEKLVVPAGTYEDTTLDLTSLPPPGMATLWPKYEAKMKAEGLNDAAIAAFRYNLDVLVSGANTMIPETAISGVESLPSLDEITVEPKADLLPKTLMLKLNGGLGTGMGLDKAKSLLPVTGSNTFLDLIAKQVGAMKQSFGVQVAFMLMNSFSTSADTLAALSKYPDLGTGSDLEFVQNKAPKVTASTLEPASWPKDPGHEWCPPGHGDLYPAMLGSGTLDKLLAKGYQYMFVSNSDNLGATMDLKLLTFFAESKAPFMMEVAERTDADKKGGHLAKDKSTGGLLLRESAQCPDEDEAEFQNVTKYKYFNTNNLWVDLVALKAMFDKYKGSLPLPVMKNGKTVDPRDKKSTKVVQLETAMGAAISCFKGATAIKIPRTRFAPVKTTNDLFALRSDAYVLTSDFRIELAPARGGVPPNIKLDGMYKFVDAMDTLIPTSVPSLVACKELVIEGPLEFAKDVTIKGKVAIKNASQQKVIVPPGVYEDTELDLTPDTSRSAGAPEQAAQGACAIL